MNVNVNEVVSKLSWTMICSTMAVIIDDIESKLA